MTQEQRQILFTLSRDEAAAARRFCSNDTAAYRDSTLFRDDSAHVRNLAQRLADQFYGIAGAHVPCPDCGPRPG